MGSGANPNDLQCMRGYSLYEQELPNYPSDHFWAVYDHLKNRIKGGAVSSEDGKVFLAWALKLSKKPEAIKYWNDWSLTGQFRWNGTICTSRAEADALKQAAIDDLHANPLKHTSVLRIVRKGDTETSIPVQHPAQIKPEAEYRVYDPETGSNIRAIDPTEAMTNSISFLAAQIAAKPVMQEIIEPYDNMTTWEQANG